MFFEAHAAVCAEVEAELQRAHGLSLRWYDVLLHLHAVPGRRLSMRELGDAVVISKSGLTGVVDRMARAGLVERTPTPPTGASRSSRSRRSAPSATRTPASTIAPPSPSGSSTGSTPADLDVIERTMDGLLGGA